MSPQEVTDENPETHFQVPKEPKDQETQQGRYMGVLPKTADKATMVSCVAIQTRQILTVSLFNSF